MVIWLVGDLVVASSIKLAAQWEQAVVFRLGKFHAVRGPGLFFIVPLVDQVRLVDIRIRAADIPAQQVITKDNVPVTINGVLFFKVATWPTQSSRCKTIAMRSRSIRRRRFAT